MAEKDRWDKVDILLKTIVLGAIPIAIGIGADNIAKSLKRGELVQSLISDLNQADTRRDVALIALDAAIEENRDCTVLWLWGCHDIPKHDQVLKIAEILQSTWIDEAEKKGQSPGELKVARDIIETRASKTYYEQQYKQRIDDVTSRLHKKAISSPDFYSDLSSDEISKKENIAQTLAAIQPSGTKITNEKLSGVRLVYIQYSENNALAKKIQSDLQSAGASAPETQQVDGIQENSLRYSSSSDEKVAQSLQHYLEKDENIQITKLIDLSRAGYRVPSGQFEVWLK